MITITIISDNVCPHCLLARNRLNRALEIFRKTVPGASTTPISIQWQAHLLQLTSPQASYIPSSGSTSASAITEAKFGADRARAKQEKLARAGAAEGINFSFAGKIGPTRDSHRLVALGKTKGWEVADALVMAIMKMYFEAGGDITSFDDLVGAAQLAGIDADEAREWLESGKGGAEVDEEVKKSIAMNITGVPTIIINDKYTVDGAEDMFGFLEALSKAKDDVSA